MTPEQALQFLANAAAKVLPISEVQNFNAAFKALQDIIPKPAVEQPKA